MKDLYLIGKISKQGFHKWLDKRYKKMEEQEQCLLIMRELRKEHKNMSPVQFYYIIKPKTMGRDQFVAFCNSMGFKVNVKKRVYKTTDSRGVIRFPNRILDMTELTGINQLWVSDITYFNLKDQTVFLTFIQDIYNREIVGHSLAINLLTASTTIPALRMAIANRNLAKGSDLVFHSDGGGQYYSGEFRMLTQSVDIINSMGENSYENPFAERLNGIIKNDYLYPNEPQNLEQLRRLLTKAVKSYNEGKPHSSLARYTPREFLRLIESGELTKSWVINKKKKVSKKEKFIININ